MSGARRNRSAADFDTVEGLQAALRSNNNTQVFADEQRTHDFPKALVGSTFAVSHSQHRSVASDDESVSSAMSSVVEPDGDLDWILTNFHAETTRSQNLKEELERLQVLKSYLILDAEREAKFERLTGFAQRIFQVPIALVSLVDLGRQWFMSNRGLGDVRETSRKTAFCAHAVISKEDMLIVPDATKDPRFSSNPLVTGPPDIRFYAGAPLQCPEGYRLGTFCIIDKQPRPQGLSLDEKQNLRELADLVVETMVQRRREKIRVLADKSHIIATTAHDLLTPLSGVQMSLSLLNEDEEFKQAINPQQVELVQTASTCADVMSRICHTAMASFRGEVENRPTTRSSQRISKRGGDSSKRVVISDMVKNLNHFMEPYPKMVPIYITVDPQVPFEIISDDLKIFRSALNYLTNAAKKTTSGSIHLKIYISKMKDTPKLVFECEDTGPGVDISLYPLLFRPINDEDDCITMDANGQVQHSGVCTNFSLEHSGLGLYSVAHQINSLEGEYGFRPREGGQGAVFWFSVPLKVSDLKSTDENGVQVVASDKPKTTVIHGTGYHKQGNGSSRPNGLRKSSSKIRVLSTGDSLSERDCKEVFHTVTRVLEEKRKADAITESTARMRRALVIDDSQVIRKSVGRALSKLGYEVTVAANGLEGFKHLQFQVFDVALCDFLMPVMDGLDCVQQYREWESANRPWIRQYIVGISAHASAVDVEKGRKAGMNDFKAKPVTLKVLKELQESEALHQISKELDQKLMMYDDPMASDDVTGTLRPSGKKIRPTYDSDAMACLIGDDASNTVTELVKKELESRGWKFVTVDDGESVLRLMKIRNWGAVFVNEELSLLTGLRCVARFRDWEKENRVKRQNSVYLISTNYVPSRSSGTGSVSYPSGFDGALGKPILMVDFNALLDEAESRISETADPKDILMK